MLTGRQPRVLLVSPPGGVSGTLAARLSAAGYEPLVASDFAGARTVLNDRPDLLVTDVKLGEFNGIHLAIVAGSRGTPAIVIGDPDPVLERDAERQQALYLTTPLDVENILVTIARLLKISRQTRRSTRKHIPGLDVLAGGLQARLLDVSYDGMRFEAAATQLPRYFVVRLLQFNFVCRVRRVWTAPVDGESETRATMRCGAAVALTDDETAYAWRALVDAMPGVAMTN
jgi:DNA-binding response OmpR family regulator